MFRDVDEFADALGGVSGRFVPTARASAEWWIDGARVNSTALRHVQFGGAATFAGAGRTGAFTLGAPLIDPSSVRVDGHALDDRSIIVVAPHSRFTAAGLRPIRWAGVTVPLERATMWTELLEAVQSRARGAQSLRLRTDRADVATLCALISRICAADGHAGLRHRASSAAAEEEVMRVAARALERVARPDGPHPGRPQCSRSRVISRALALIEAHREKPLLVQDLCRAAQVSERTLRNVFHEYFGVGPMRLLRVRQLHEIRGALTEAGPSGNTIAGIASRYGVWDFSLFARNYKALYGESPSQTLHQPPQRREAFSESWIRHASRVFLDDVSRPGAHRPPSDGEVAAGLSQLNGAALTHPATGSRA